MPLYKNAFFEILICQNFKIWKIQIQRLFKDFKGLSRTYSVFKDFQGPGVFFPKLKDFQGLLKDPMNPASDSMATLSVLVPDRMTPTLVPKAVIPL